jgi:hypothetical protein
MSSSLVIVADGQSQLEYDRQKRLPDDQRAYLDRMDVRMDAGIRLGENDISYPDQLQRAQFVALQLIQAIEGGQEGLAAATCAYLANRVPELRQVRVETRDGKRSVDLVFDRPYAPEARIEFYRPASEPAPE